MPVLLEGRPLAFLAFQASSFMDGFPTEMAVCRDPSEEPPSLRLRPDPSWAGLDWDAGTEAITGLSRADLDATGVAPGEACRRLAEWTRGHRIVVRHEAVSLPLLALLHGTAGLAGPQEVAGLYGTLDELIARLPFDYDATYGEVVLPYCGARPYRAAYDASAMAEAASHVAAGRPLPRQAM